MTGYRFIRQFAPTLVTLAGAILLATYPAFPKDIRWLTITIGIIFALAGAVIAVVIRPTRNNLLSSIQTLSEYLRVQDSPANERMTMVLANLMSDLHLITTHHRASLFAKTVDGDWLLVARYSENAEIAMPGRQKYAADQGLVNQTWKEKQVYISDLPATRVRWDNRVAKDFNMDPSEVANLRMQSLSYACMRIDRQADGHGHPVGVLIVESEKADGVLPGVLDDLQVHHSVQLLAMECDLKVKVASLRTLKAVKELELVKPDEDN